MDDAIRVFREIYGMYEGYIRDYGDELDEETMAAIKQTMANLEKIIEFNDK